MQRFACNPTTLSLLFTAAQATADVFYSDLRNTSIPTTYQGNNIDVDVAGGWDLNPFMGGVYLYDNTAFQPARDGTGGMDTVLNFTAGSNSLVKNGLNTVTLNAIFDQIIVEGDLDFTDLTTLNLIFNASSAAVCSNTFRGASQSWTLFDVAGTTSNFANLSLITINRLDSGSNPFSTTGGSFSLSQSGNDVILNYVIPEPNVAALIGGFGMLVLLRRRR